MTKVTVCVCSQVPGLWLGSFQNLVFSLQTSVKIIQPAHFQACYMAQKQRQKCLQIKSEATRQSMSHPSCALGNCPTCRVNWQLQAERKMGTPRVKASATSKCEGLSSRARNTQKQTIMSVEWWDWDSCHNCHHNSHQVTLTGLHVLRALGFKSLIDRFHSQFWTVRGQPKCYWPRPKKHQARRYMHVWALWDSRMHLSGKYCRKIRYILLHEIIKWQYYQAVYKLTQCYGIAQGVIWRVNEWTV